MSRDVRIEAKPYDENPSSRKEKEWKFEQHVFNMSLSSLEWAEWVVSGEIL